MCSKEGQDKFALHCLGSPKHGTFLDIGCGPPEHGNNTIVMDRMGWTGICIDILAQDFTGRSAKFIQADASTLDYPRLLEAHKMLNVIDYLSVDVDGATLNTVSRLPWRTHRFKVATIEHDFYRAGDFVRTAVRRILEDHGYTMVCGDVAFPSDSGPMTFEDWWVDANLVPETKWSALLCSGNLFADILGRIPA